MKIVKHDINEELAIRLLGWKWVSFIGIPVRSTEGYPAKRRVRQLMSAKAMRDSGWQEFLEKHEGRDAVGDEPLAYCYGSSLGPAIIPTFTILVDD